MVAVDAGGEVGLAVATKAPGVTNGFLSSASFQLPYIVNK
jgi:hypothetical protein